MYENKTGNVYEDFSKDKEMFHFSNYSPKSKYYNDWKKLMARKMKDETAGVPNKEFFRFKPKIRSFFVVDSSEYKKAKSVNKNVVATINQNEYKDVLLNNKCLRHSMNRIQSKNHKIGPYEISKISLSCFDNKIYREKTVILITIQNSFFVKLQKYYFNFLSSQNSFLSSY